MLRVFEYTFFFLAFVLILVGVSGVMAYDDALTHADQWRDQADLIIAQGHGGDALGEEHLAILLKVEDPDFLMHRGFDLWTPGAGVTTITQALSKRLVIDPFNSSFGKIRQAGFVFGLESSLTKDQILALWLDTLDMGGPEGALVGFDHASTVVYRRPASDLNKGEFMRLVAALTAPASYRLTEADANLDERVRRIERLVAGTCEPHGLRDVWFDGCASPQSPSQEKVMGFHEDVQPILRPQRARASISLPSETNTAPDR